MKRFSAGFVGRSRVGPSPTKAARVGRSATPAKVSMDRTQQEPQDVDGRGLSISTAILYEVFTALQPLDPGGELRIRADATPVIDSDIRAWARTTGHDLIAVEETDPERRYLIRKTDRPRSRPPWAFVISDPGLEELLSPLGFALAAALGGSEVALYFQGPGVRVLERSFRERLKGLHRGAAGEAETASRTRRPDLRLRSVDGALQGQHRGPALRRYPRCRLSELRRGDGCCGGADLSAVAANGVTGRGIPLSRETPGSRLATSRHGRPRLASPRVLQAGLPDRAGDLGSLRTRRPANPRSSQATGAPSPPQTPQR
jgi:TusA-related sulfurtransferase